MTSTQSLPPPNLFQRTVAAVYADGDFAWIMREPRWRDLLNDCADSLFTFLMIELSDTEDCDNLKTAISRMETACADVDNALHALRRLSGCHDSSNNLTAL